MDASTLCANTEENRINDNGYISGATSYDVHIEKLLGIPIDVQMCRVIFISGSSAVSTTFHPVNANGTSLCIFAHEADLCHKARWILIRASPMSQQRTRDFNRGMNPKHVTSQDTHDVPHLSLYCRIACSRFKPVFGSKACAPRQPSDNARWTWRSISRPETENISFAFPRTPHPDRQCYRTSNSR